MNSNELPMVFAGHETFPLRQSWLKKIHKSIPNNLINKDFFRDDSLISDYGVGKNMLASMRHWAIATSMLEDTTNYFKLNHYFEELLGSKSIEKSQYKVPLDPFFENPNSVWFIHWRLVASPIKSTTWFWLFNRVSSSSFTKEDIIKSLLTHVESQKTKPSNLTLIRDVETCLRSYSAKTDSKSGAEEASDSLLIELGLISEDKRGLYTFKRGHKPSLSARFFAFTLAEYWHLHHNDSNQLSFDLIAYHDFSPGKAFKLDDESIMEYIDQIEALSDGIIRWSSSAGIRQLVRDSNKWNDLNLLSMYKKIYI